MGFWSRAQSGAELEIVFDFDENSEFCTAFGMWLDEMGLIGTERLRYHPSLHQQHHGAAEFVEHARCVHHVRRRFGFLDGLERKAGGE